MPQQHTCLTCGFLTVAGREIDAAARQSLAADLEIRPSETARPGCYQELWDDDSLTDVHREIVRQRTCAAYLRHAPGLSPKAHLVKAVQRRRRRPLWRMAGVTGVVVIVAAILGRSCIA